MDTAVLADFLAASVRIATPLLLAGLGGMLSERASEKLPTSASSPAPTAMNTRLVTVSAIAAR